MKDDKKLRELEYVKYVGGGFLERVLGTLYMGWMFEKDRMGMWRAEKRGE